jgi:hypothetical protein
MAGVRGCSHQCCVARENARRQIRKLRGLFASIAWALIALIPPHGFVYLRAVMAILGRQSHDWFVYFGGYRGHVRKWLVGPFPPLIKGIFHRNASSWS